VAAPSYVIRFWRALDDLLGSVRPTRWGAVVTDGRFPAIWDANYARLDAEATGVTAAEIERDLLPALRASGASIEHVVAFDPDAAVDVIAELSARGHRLGWDAVLATDDPSSAPNPEVQAIEMDTSAWDDVRRSLGESFGIEGGDPLEQLMRLERDVLASGAKRWFGVRREGRWVSLAALLTLEGVGYVDNVATETAFRERGLAAAVTSHVVRTALEEGAETVFLLADPDEPKVVALYERLGFREVARLASTRGPVPA